MPRDSYKSPRRSSKYDDDSRDSQRNDHDPNSDKFTSGRSSRHERRKWDDEEQNNSRFRPGRDERQDGRRLDGDRRGYDENDRERERNRDRERYDARSRQDGRDGDRRYTGHSSRSQRRSASPQARSSRPRSKARSASREDSPADKVKPNFAPSGLLAAETNTVKAVDGSKTVLKYNEPPEARKPILGWRLYVFKGSEQVELLHIHRQSAYLIGRDRLVADIALDHPSCSKQHAVIQYRYIQEKNEFGDSKGVIKPFIIDLESTNGTHVNDEAIPASRFYELKPSDVIKFGQSTREYVLLHDEIS